MKKNLQSLCQPLRAIWGVLLAPLRLVRATFVWVTSALVSWVKRSRGRVQASGNEASPNEPTHSHRPRLFLSIGRWLLALFVSFALGFFTNAWFAEWQAAREQSAILQQLGHIAYVRNGDIWLCRADGSHRRLLVGGAKSVGVAWGSNGTRLAFVCSIGTDERSTVALYVADLENGELIKYTDDIPGKAVYSELTWAEGGGNTIAVAFDYEPIRESSASPRCLAYVAKGGLYGEGVEILPRCYCPWLDAMGGLYAISHDPGVTPSAGWTASIIGPVGDVIASTQMKELEEAGYAIRTMALSPRANEVVFSVRWNIGGELWTVQWDLGHKLARPKKLCDLQNIVEFGWHPSGTHLLLRQESEGHEFALPSTEGLLLVERATGLFRQLLTKPREGYWHFSRQCWSHDGQWLLVTHADHDRKGDEWSIIEPLFLNVQTNERISLSLPLVDDPRLYLQPTATPIHGTAQWRFDPSGHIVDGPGMSHRSQE